MVELRGQTLAYGPTVVLENVTLAIRPGERVALLGRSGAGKSTLLAAIRDSAMAAGEDVALVPQENGLVPQLSLFHNVHMGRLHRHSAFYNLVTLLRPFRRDRAEVAALARELGLEPLLDRPVERLSGGQRQRTAVARAIHAGGGFLLADEPVSALDEMQAPEVLRALLSRFPTSVISLHDIGLALAHCTRLVGLKDRRIIFDLRTGEQNASDIDRLYAA
ncbi:ATP-binding cassette domain-containing protein [Paracoccus sp. PS-1]|uniref:ATP-binding cassette domain-containing protein n=1 Tax=unclassified Paracoccus (in: a-proteobacteria) TaxID=2688777 RepID=UPI0004908828|nr:MULTISPECIES: ATP-binding cassette domain-containing protein [unclassified Paracoccus (in: a-proteobacteria)]MDQ7260696.1 ATP-binding cassette domain-containing protein [Paracoccus sp. PS1]RQP06543.1 MAG: ATP-binding cassette domain-containing protein [Paracoccus sp. BP8]UFM65666.1 ATP-binding cassette domain-containing protein [Paracoccus sp. MA]